MLHSTVADIIVLGNEVSPEPNVWYRIYKNGTRMLGLMTAAALVIPLGLTELRAFLIWIIGLQLDPYHHKLKCSCLSRDSPIIASWQYGAK